MTLRLAPVDVFDDRSLAAWHAVYLEAESYGRDLPTPWMLPEMAAQLRRPAVDREVRLLLGETVEGPVAAGIAELPLKDNRERAEVSAFVLPGARRRGLGSAVLTALEADVAASGRRILGSMVGGEYDDGPEGSEVPGAAFLRAHGYDLALVDVLRAAPLPIDDDLLAALADEAAPHHTDYRLLSFVDHCPEELLETYGRLVGTLVTEAPLGGLTMEEEVWDAERIRHDVAVALDSGRHSYVTLALDAHDQAVAYSHLVVPDHDPGRVYQWGTLVHPAHRGRRLGLAVKAANHRHLQHHVADRSLCLTWNAEVNDSMIGINERFGYVPRGRGYEFEKTVT